MDGENDETEEISSWGDGEQVRRVLDHYKRQSDDEAVAEDEAAYEATAHTTMEIPLRW